MTMLTFGPGVRLGPYELTAALGAGGMGQVYRARDTRLGRDVAVKVLPPDFAQNPSRLERFEHEARTVAALNHPNIVALYDIGADQNVTYLVTELVEGESLRAADLTPRKVVEIAAQIADGLAAAHAAGVTHRDLKPENVMVTRDGRVKILDFGLAKVAAGVSADGPTLPHTHVGLVMGTVGYMSPEQARGATIDHRSDIFSFGVVLYELVAGTRPFSGDTPAEVMTAILRQDPPALPISLPQSLRQIVSRCLEKNPEERFQSARDLGFGLRQLSGALTTSSDAAAPVAPRVRSRAVWIATATLFIGFVTGGTIAVRWSAAADTLIEPLELTRLTNEEATEWFPEFSPDGQAIAYGRSSGRRNELLVQAIEADNPTIVAQGPVGTPFWSPDGTRVCYNAARAFWCVSAAGGTPQRILGEPGSFTPDGKALLVLRVENDPPQLFISSPPGANPVAVPGVTLPEQVTAVRMSPDGSKLLARTSQQNELWVVPYPSGTPRRIDFSANLGSASWYGDSRHLLISETGSNPRGYRLTIVDTDSRARRLVLSSTGAIVSSSLSPDGKRIVYSSGEPDWDIVEYSMDGASSRPVAASPALDNLPTWSPSGDRFAYVVSGSGTYQSLWARNADGSAPSVVVPQLDMRDQQPRYSPDGQRIAYVSGSGLYTIAASGGRAVRIVSADVVVTRLCWSADGQWVWYQEVPANLWKVPSQGGEPTLVTQGATLADCSPTGEIAFRVRGSGVQLLSPDEKQQREIGNRPLSGAGVSPLFGDGGKLLYALREDGRSLDVVDVATGMTLRSIEFALPSADIIRAFSVHPDGRRVLLMTGGLRYDLWVAEGFAQPATGWRQWFRHWAIPPASQSVSGRRESLD